MGSFKRLLLWITVIFGGVGFLAYQGSLQPLWQGIYAASILGGLALLLFTGGAPAPPPPRRRPAAVAMAEEESESDASLPAPVTESEGAAGERAAKLARSRGLDVTTEEEEVEVEFVEEEVEVEEDAFHEAKEYVVEVDAESMLEAEIERYVDERREQHGEIRDRIERRRRTQLARIRADAAKVFASLEDREDLAAIVAAGDGVQLLADPAPQEPSRPYGNLLIRIDESRIIELKVPLDRGFRAAEDPTSKLDGTTTRVGDQRILDLADGQLPPPPGGGDLPLPPPPGDGALPLPPPPGDLPLPPPPVKADDSDSD